MYKQAPYTECEKEEFTTLNDSMPTIDWSKLAEYEMLDNTTSSQELACTAGGCEI